MKTVIASLLFLGFAAPAFAAPKVDDLGWLAGSWAEEKDGVTTREIWLPPLGGTMSGVNQTNQAGKKPAMDYMAISTEPAGVMFTAIVGHQPPTPFVLTSTTLQRLVFENPTHDFPHRVIYWRCGQTMADLCARIDGKNQGQPQAQEWHYHPVR